MARQERLSLFLAKEKTELQRITKDYQGFAGIIINGHENLNLADSAIKHVFSVSNQNNNTECQINFTEMPFANEYFDIVILNHVFDEVDAIEPALREAKRILRHDGVLLINGFERMRLCARVMQRRFSKKTCLKRKRYGVLDIQAKLAELEFKLETYHFDFCRNKKLEKYLKHIVPFLGIGFWIKAQKQMLPLTPLAENSWELAPLITPIATRPEYLSPQKRN